jgi:hypothetical protein
MILATTTVEDVDQFLKVFGTKGADKRALHGSKGSTVSATRPRRTGCGCCSSGTNRGGRTSCPIPRSRRS